MRQLHTVNKSPFERDSLHSCLRVAQAGSTVLLIEDGVYAALRGTTPGKVLTESMPRLAICALRPDLEARGIEAERLVAGITLVDYTGFVALAVEHDSVQAWL